MMQKKKRCVFGVLLVLCGVVTLWAFLQHMFGYKDWYLGSHPEVETYVGTNVVSMFADFSFFTYITMIIFGVWCILLGCSLFFNESKFEHFLRKSSVVSFIFTNYFFTVVMYTTFEFTFSGGTFGLYSKTLPLAWHNLGLNIVSHYVLFACACVIFAKIKTNKSSLEKGKTFVSLFLIIYYVIVKIVGEFAYRIRWFPYVIFDAKTFGKMLGISNYGASVFVLVVTCCLIGLVYLLLYTLFAKVKDKQQESALRKSAMNK